MMNWKTEADWEVQRKTKGAAI